MGNAFMLSKASALASKRNNRSSTRALQYQITSTRVDSLPCTYCSFLININNVHFHEKECSQNPENVTATCEYCQNQFNLKSCSSHLNVCTENPENIQIDCQFCHKGFNVLSIVSHVDDCKKNPQNIKVSCEFCNKDMPQLIIKQHETNCEKNPRNIRVICRFCQKMFDGIEYLNHFEACEREQKRIAEEKKIEKQCSICLEQITDLSQTAFLVCLHKFHYKCIDDWGQNQKFCPICRTRFAL